MPRLDGGLGSFDAYRQALLTAQQRREQALAIAANRARDIMVPTGDLEINRRAQDAAMYLRQQFPGLAAAFPGVQIGTQIGKNVYAPRYRSGRGYPHGGYVDDGGAPYAPRVVAVGSAPQLEIYPGRANPGMITSTPPAFTGPKTVEEVQADQYAAREAAGVSNMAVPSGQIPLKSGFMWIGGPEGETVYDEWLAET